jgi:4a-hydroxytetrahydrobiopterin dehydratase
MSVNSDLKSKHCEACEGIQAALTAEQIKNLRPQLSARWEVSVDNLSLYASFRFEDFYETMAFVNAIAWFANIENHHPDLEVGYNYCHVRWTTHAIKGLSHNDFICAAKVDGLLMA